MRTLSVFNFLTLDGYFEGPEKGDISWHSHAGEENGFAAEMLKHGNVLLFGRITYDMMAGYWPTLMAAQNDPEIATGMNKTEKIVFSNTLKEATWNNTSIIKGDIVTAVKNLKQTPGNNLTILGSGTIITLFAAHGLIDEYQFMIDPVVIGKGNSIFKGISKQVDLKLIAAKALNSGIILATYAPAEA